MRTVSPDGRGVRLVFAGALLVVGAALGASGLAAQERWGDCDIVSWRLLDSDVAFAGYRVTWISLPSVVCPDGTRIRADSAVVYESQGRTEFIGGFRYEDTERVLTSVNADYLEQQGQLFARESVVLQTHDGEEVRGDDLTLYERGEGPEDDELVVNGQPAFARLNMAASASPADVVPEGAPPEDAAPEDAAPDDVAPDDAAPEDAAPDDVPPDDVPPDDAVPEDVEPFEVSAPRLSFQGQNQFFAAGGVIVDRDSLHATTSALSFDRTSGNLQMTGEAHLETGDAVFDAQSMSLFLPDGEVSSITLDGEGHLVSEDLEITGEQIRVEVNDGTIEHLVAVHRGARVAQAAAVPQPSPAGSDPATGGGGPEASGQPEAPPRPRALARDFELTGDSLDVLAPDGVLETVYAVGTARGVSTPPTDSVSTDQAGVAPPPDGRRDPAASEDVTEPGDMARDSTGIDPAILANDWLEGDTIVATFRPVAANAEIEGPASAETEPSDGTGVEDGDEYVLDQLVAIGNARSLYRSPPRREEGREEEPVPDRDRWAISYVLGSRIVLTVVDGAVESAEVDDAVGIYQEPEEPDVAPAEDSAAGDDPAAVDSRNEPTPVDTPSDPAAVDTPDDPQVSR